MRDDGAGEREGEERRGEERRGEQTQKGCGHDTPRSALGAGHRALDAHSRASLVGVESTSTACCLERTRTGDCKRGQTSLSGATTHQGRAPGRLAWIRHKQTGAGSQEVEGRRWRARRGGGAEAEGGRETGSSGRERAGSRRKKANADRSPQQQAAAGSSRGNRDGRTRGRTGRRDIDAHESHVRQGRDAGAHCSARQAVGVDEDFALPSPGAVRVLVHHVARGSPDRDEH